MESSRPPYLDLVCPACRGELSLATPSSAALRCAACAIEFPIADGSADFSLGESFDAFSPDQPLAAEALAGLELELSGVRARIDGYYAPLLRAAAGGRRDCRVLDSGCGNGLSVELLAEAGFEAWGNDCSQLRKWQWRERRDPARLVVADSRRLPFPDGFFDFVISSGVIEHVGVVEGRNPGYEVRPAPGQRDARRRFLAELLRVLAPGGKLYLDFPNGAFPIDFWHGDAPGAARFHSIREGFLPSLQEIRSLVGEVGTYAVRPVSPAGRLRFEQVGRHWYGRLLRGSARRFLHLMSRPSLRFLAGSRWNPYLVLELAGGAGAVPPAAPGASTKVS